MERKATGDPVVDALFEWRRASSEEGYAMGYYEGLKKAKAAPEDIAKAEQKSGAADAKEWEAMKRIAETPALSLVGLSLQMSFLKYLISHGSKWKDLIDESVADNIADGLHRLSNMS